MKTSSASVESWRDVAGYEGIYKVSRQGDVYPVPRKSKNGNAQGGYLLRPQKYRNGYVFFHLSRDGKRKCKTAHRLVAEAYVPNPSGYAEVNHRDGDKENNNVENLEWVTRSQNNAHAVACGLRDMSEMRRKAAQANSRPIVLKLDGVEVARFPSLKYAELVTGLAASSISNCLNGTSATCDGYEVEDANC